VEPSTEDLREWLVGLEVENSIEEPLSVAPQTSETKVLRCLNENEECSGEVSLHSYGGRLKAFPRCSYHHAIRCTEQQRIEGTYPPNPPDNFDPAYAGEEW
jgi:hypothetical protein